MQANGIPPLMHPDATNACIIGMGAGAAPVYRAGAAHGSRITPPARIAMNRALRPPMRSAGRLVALAAPALVERAYGGSQACRSGLQS